MKWARPLDCYVYVSRAIDAYMSRARHVNSFGPTTCSHRRGCMHLPLASLTLCPFFSFYKIIFNSVSLAGWWRLFIFELGYEYELQTRMQTTRTPNGDFTKATICVCVCVLCAYCTMRRCRYGRGPWCERIAILQWDTNHMTCLFVCSFICRRRSPHEGAGTTPKNSRFYRYVCIYSSDGNNRATCTADHMNCTHEWVRERARARVRFNKIIGQ